MPRHHRDWLQAFTEYAKHSEAPKHMHFWTGVSALAGTLRAKVWIDQKYFRWVPNFYIIIVAPPGIVSKTTTADMGMRLLRQVPGINFGPDAVTWQSLAQTFAGTCETFEHEGVHIPMSALTLSSGEFGNLLDPNDRAMVDFLVTLWDGKLGEFKKATKGSGNDSIVNPWINLIACTTPSWIAGNFPEYMIGGGFTSRCIFVYAEEKAKLVAYPYRHVPDDFKEQEQRLVEDLIHINDTLRGNYILEDAAERWGTLWYESHYASKPPELDDDRFGGYLARKQTHIHKLAMVIAASQRDDMVIAIEDLKVASEMVTDLEPDMAMVFGKIGKSEQTQFAERLVWFVRARGPCLPYFEVYRYMHQYFPSMRDFEDILSGCVRAQYVEIGMRDGKAVISLHPSQQVPAAQEK